MTGDGTAPDSPDRGLVEALVQHDDYVVVGDWRVQCRCGRVLDLPHDQTFANTHRAHIARALLDGPLKAEREAHQREVTVLLDSLNDAWEARDEARARAAEAEAAVGRAQHVPDWLAANGMSPQDVAFVRANLRAALARPEQDGGA